MKRKRRLLIFAGLLLIVGVVVLLHPYPRQLLFGPKIQGVPLCVWQEDFRRQNIGVDRWEDTLVAKYLAWMRRGADREIALDWGKLSDDETEFVHLSMIGEPHPGVRGAAARNLLGRVSKEAFFGLVRLLDDPVESVRESAAGSIYLSLAKADNALDEIKNVLTSSDPHRRRLAMEIIQRSCPSRKEKLETLVRMLDDPSIDIRKHAVIYLGFPDWNKKRMAKAAVPKLSACLRGSDPLLQLEAACALWNIEGRHTESLPIFRQSLRNGNFDVRDTAVRRLHHIKQACPDLWDELVLCATSDKELEVRKNALLTIGNCGRKAVPLLIAGARDESQDVSYYALVVLKELGPEGADAVPFLLTNWRMLGDEAVFALANMRAKEAVPILLEMLDDPERVPKDSIVNVLGEMGPVASEAVPRLLALLNDSNPSALKKAAGAALGKIGKSNAQVVVPALCTLLDDSDIMVRFSGVTGLYHLGPAAMDAVPSLLRAMLQAPRSAKGMFALALGGIGPEAKSAVPALLTLLDDVKCDKREGFNVPTLVNALGSIGSDAPTVVPALISVLSGENIATWHRQACIGAVQALARFGPSAQAAIPALTTLLDDDDEELAEAAALALTAIDPVRYPKK